MYKQELIKRIDAVKNAGYQELIGRWSNIQIRKTLESYRQYPEGLIQQLVECLKSNCEVKNTFDNKIANAGNLRYPTGLKSTAIWLVNQSLNCETKLVVENFFDYVHSEYSIGFEVLALSGIDVNESIELTDDLSLIPFSSLTPSFMTEALDPNFLKMKHHLERGHFPQRINFGYRAPKAALTYKVKVVPKTYSSFDAPHNYIDTSIVLDVCRLLTLIDKSTPVILGEWFELDESVPFKEGMGKSYSLPIPEVFSPRDIKLGVVHQKTINELINSYFCIPIKYRKLLKLPLERLNISRRRKNSVDRAIDLGIAYESLFLTDNPESISLTLRKRVSNHLPKSQYDFNIFETIRKFYNCRSDAAHNGEVKDVYQIKNYKEFKTDELLSISDTLMVDSIVKILKTKNMPKWW